MSANDIANLSLASKSKKKKKVVVKVGMVGDSQIGKCWGRGTEFMMHDGTVKQVEHIQEGDKLLGDDGTFRTVQPGSVRVGHTANDAAIPESRHASMYRITSEDKGRTPWTCNGDHILVLQFEQIVSEIVQQQAAFTFTHFELPATSTGVITCVDHCFDTFEAASAARSHLLSSSVISSYSSSSPFTWECTVDQFLSTDQRVQAAARMYQPSSVTFSSPKDSLKNRLARITGDENVNDDAVFESAWCIGAALTSSPSTIDGHSILSLYDLPSSKRLSSDLLREDVAIRRHILAGAIDVSSSATKSDSCVVSSVSLELAEEIVSLARSIGVRTSTIEAKKEEMTYEVELSGALDSIPTRTFRSSNDSVVPSNPLAFAFRVESIGHDEYFGFTLDGNGRCLLRDFTITHNTSLMVKYVEGNFNEDYIQTLGVNFMEKTIALRNTDITFSIWDLGGQQEYLHMLPLVCNDAVALLFMFDLSRKATLTSVKNWYKQARLLNKTATPFLIGTKYDYFTTLKAEEQKEMTLQARRFAKAMKAPLIFCSASHAVNIHKIFKVVLAKVFDLKCTVQQVTQIGEPIIEYEQSATATDDGGAGEGSSTGGSGGGDDQDGGNTTSSTGGDDVAASAAVGGHRRNTSSVGSTSSNGEGAGGRHRSNASIGSNPE